MLQLFYLVIFSLFLNVSLLAGENINTDDLISRQIRTLDSLVAATQQNLDNQIKLQALIKDYQAAQKHYLEISQNNEMLFKMVKNASLILDMIKQNHLTQAFDPAFLSELSIVSKPAAKRGLPKP